MQSFAFLNEQSSCSRANICSRSNSLENLHCVESLIIEKNRALYRSMLPSFTLMQLSAFKFVRRNCDRLSLLSQVSEAIVGLKVIVILYCSGNLSKNQVA